MSGETIASSSSPPSVSPSASETSGDFPTSATRMAAERFWWVLPSWISLWVKVQFQVPYLLCLLLLGLPLFFLEMALGQYSGTSCTKVTESVAMTSESQVFCRLAPGLKGLGYGILTVPAMMTLYYTVIMAWALFYLFQVKCWRKIRKFK